MSGWERIEVEWLTDLFEVAPFPWREGLVYAWLRHAERCCRIGRTYWTPRTAAPQVAADARAGKMPGRRAIWSVTGIPEETARRMLADWSAWMDPLSIAEDGEAGLEPRPAGARGAGGACAPGFPLRPPRVAPTSPPGSPRVPPTSPPGSEPKEQVEPAASPYVSPGSTPGSPYVPPGSPLRPPRVAPDRARDLRASPTHAPSQDGAPSLSAGPAPPAPGTEPDATAGPLRPGAGRGGGWQRAVGGAPAAPPSRGAPDDGSLVAVWAHARLYQPDLPVWGRGLLPASLREQEPVALCRVLDWARLAPDPDAAAIRRAMRDRRRGALGPGYVLDARWLGDRLARAEAWDREGRPEAEDAELGDVEARARADALRAEQLAEDRARWPGWSPPPTWQRLPREYVALAGLAERGQTMLANRGADDQEGLALLEAARAQGWVPDWPAPGEART